MHALRSERKNPPSQFSQPPMQTEKAWESAARFVGMNGMDSNILILSILAKHSGTCIRILSVVDRHLVKGCSQLLWSRSAFEGACTKIL